MKKEERFVKIFSQGGISATEILVDKQTGVNYLFHHQGYAGGLTVLLDKDGKPVVTKVEE
ncbi:MAG: xylan 1,4-beta-xylosidase [Lachnospiraceae bacterium]|nr:xylan 1,4-beta-xylosidase [Lachnospiraceae bacterium]